jgi:hypothetical protein
MLSETNRQHEAINMNPEVERLKLVLSAVCPGGVNLGKVGFQQYKLLKTSWMIRWKCFQLRDSG